MKTSLNLLEKFFSSCNQRNWGYSSPQISAAEEKLSISFPKILKHEALYTTAYPSSHNTI